MLKNEYEEMFTLADLSSLPEDIPEQTLPIFLAVFFQQLALEKHDYHQIPLLSIIREFEFQETYYRQSIIEEVPKMIPTMYFLSLINQNKTLNRIHHYVPKLPLRQDYDHEQGLSKIKTEQQAIDFVVQITEDDYFKEEVKLVYQLAKEYYTIMVEKQTLSSLSIHDNEAYVNNVKKSKI